MKNSINVYPEIIAKTICENELDIYLIWSLAKLTDKTGNGIVSYKKILEIASNLLGIRSTQIYLKLNSGIDNYWSKPFLFKNNKCVCLFGLKKIITRLKPNLTRCKPFVIPLDFFDNIELSNKNLKSIFISLVAGRFDDHRPLSVASLMNNCGLSESTIRNAIKDSAIIEVKNNFQILFESNNKESFKDFKHSSYKLLGDNGKYQLVKQLPNSYIVNVFNRLPLKARPKELKLNDRQLDFSLEKTYHNKQGEILIDNAKIVSINSCNR